MIRRLCARTMERDFRLLREASQHLGKTATLDEMAAIVAQECQNILRADAVCVHLLEENGDILSLRAAVGCTDDFLKKWKRVPRTIVPELRDGTNPNIYFLGSAKEFKKAVPISSELVDKSGRKTVAYTPFILDGRIRGMLGFSYNQVCRDPPAKELVLTLASICASALEYARLFEQERRAHQRADAVSQAKSDFVAGISHEIRSPLGLIQGFADLVFENSNLDIETRQWILGIRRNAKQLSLLIGDVLDMSKIEAKKIEVQRIPFSTQDFFQEIKDTFELQAADKLVKLDFQVESLPEVLVSDPIRIRQIVLNLIGNALKFTFQGRIEVVAQFGSGFLEVRVTDTGIGIPEDRQVEIFERFTQAENSDAHRYGGTGLGLPISEELAKALGGTLVLEKSRPGLGSTFLCTIKCSEPNFANVAHSQALLNSDESLHNLHILLVEDNLDNQDLLRQILERAGAKVDLARTGGTGVSLALKNHYDVVLMDIQMPGIDGFKAVEILREKGYRQPVAALTANAMRSELESYRDRGFDDYLTKPIERPKLIQAIRRLSSH